MIKSFNKINGNIGESIACNFLKDKKIKVNAIEEVTKDSDGTVLIQKTIYTKGNIFE